MVPALAAERWVRYRGEGGGGINLWLRVYVKVSDVDRGTSRVGIGV